MKINLDTINNKSSSLDNLDEFLCNDSPDILNIENKFDPFSIEQTYNYANNLISNKNELPDINLDLSKIVHYYKNLKEYSMNELNKEIALFNNYFDTISKNITFLKIESLREKSIIYYLFFFMSRAFLYIILNNNFIANKENVKDYTKFFKNYKNIVKTCILYLKQDSKINKIAFEDSNEKNINNLIYAPFKCLKNYQNEWKNAIINCQTFLALILSSIETKNIRYQQTKILNKEISELMEIFVENMDILFNVNKYFGIIDYKDFYNDEMSKKINFKKEFTTYLKNEKIRKDLEKQKEKEKNKDEEKDKEDKGDNDNDNQNNDNDIQNINELNEEEQEEEEEEEIEEQQINNNKEKKEPQLKFSLLDYMWLFNPAAKNEIIILFNDHQKRSELFKTMHRVREAHPPLFFSLGLFIAASNDVFLTIRIRRNNLIEDALNELSKTDIKLQNPIKVKFIGEQGVDEGGVRKEFFLLFIRQIFDPNYGMFTYNSKTRLYWFNHYSFEPKIKYELIGIIFGLAIYNNIILDVKFPLSVYKKLLGIKPNLEDMKEYDPELFKNLKYLKECNEPNLKEALDLDFTIIDDKFGEKLEVSLKPDGEKIEVDNSNKDEYVDLYLDWFFNKSIKEVFTSFEKGFYRVFNRDLSKILSPEELELIICGTQILDFNELKKVCRYEEYAPTSETIQDFWEIVLQFSEEEKKKFLSFVTGCDRAPIEGLGSLPITISNGGTDLSQLPSAHTCFNNLILPNYQNKEKLKKNLLIAINNSEGFGLI